MDRTVFGVHPFNIRSSLSTSEAHNGDKKRNSVSLSHHSPILVYTTAFFSVRLWHGNAHFPTSNLCPFLSFFPGAQVLFYCRNDMERVQGALLLARSAVGQYKSALYALAVIFFNGSGIGRDHKVTHLSHSILLHPPPACPIEATFISSRLFYHIHLITFISSLLSHHMNIHNPLAHSIQY